MKTNLLLALLGLLALCGCEDNPTVNQAENKIVTTINGRVLHRMSVKNELLGAHYVYYFDDVNQPVTSNYHIGKQRVVVVSIDGKPVSTNILEDIK